MGRKLMTEIHCVNCFSKVDVEIGAADVSLVCPYCQKLVWLKEHTLVAVGGDGTPDIRVVVPERRVTRPI